MAYINRQRGFTLIELMIVVLIVSILASIAYPSYQNQVRRTNRTEAMSLLTDVANRQQQYLMDAREYADSLDDLNITASDRFDKYYTLEFDVDNEDTPPTFELTAAPKSGSSMEGDISFTLDSTGAKTPADDWK
jgi:type IV pilus assembly protein PilE